MKKEDLQGYEGKECILFLKSDHRYKGEVLEIRENSLIIKDRFLSRMLFSLDEIKIIYEVDQNDEN